MLKGSLRERLLLGVFFPTVSVPLYHCRVPGVPLCSWSTDVHLVLTVKQKAIHFVWHFLLIHQCRCRSRLLQGSVCLSPPWSESSTQCYSGLCFTVMPGMLVLISPSKRFWGQVLGFSLSHNSGLSVRMSVCLF